MDSKAELNVTLLEPGERCVAGIPEMALGIASTLRGGIAPNPCRSNFGGKRRKMPLSWSSSSSMSALTPASRSGKFEWIRLSCTS